MVAETLHNLRDYRLARTLNEDTLARFRRVLGEDHPDTLITANNLARNLQYLGDDRQARTLDEDTLDRLRRVLGEDDPDTLISAHNRAADLYMLGDYHQSRTLHEDTLARQRRVVGEDLEIYALPLALYRARALRVFRDGSLRPDGVEIEFGVKLSAETGAIIAKGTAEGHLVVRLTWSPSAAAPDTALPAAASAPAAAVPAAVPAAAVPAAVPVPAAQGPGPAAAS